MTARKVDFLEPPVVETRLGVFFAPISGWNLLHYGLIWGDKLRGAYPQADMKAPTGPIGAGDFDLGDPNDPNLGGLPVRCRYTNADETQLLFIQRNAFVRHWRATGDHPDYEHYDKVKPLFQRDWRVFCEFLAEQKLAAPAVWQCEVGYINHLVRGREWNSLDDLSSLFPTMASSKFGEWKDLALNSFALGYAVDQGKTRLQIVGQPGLRQSDGKEIFQLSLTATGGPAGPDISSILVWLDHGHAAVVENFRDFTANELHSLWGIK